MSGSRLSVVQTTSGIVRGPKFNGTASFLGVPFGYIEGEKGRFQAAIEHPEWTGTFDALFYGKSAPQPDTRLGPETTIRAQWAVLLRPSVGNGTEGVPYGDQCLNLNIWTPLDSEGEKLPVLVWLHGGSFHSGFSTQIATQGSKTARENRMVVVSIGHRLGLFACARLDLLPGDQFPDAGVLGQLDIILGLEWIQKNIEGFNGDPSNVTIIGQSGGGMKITTLMGMPAARDLFHKGINCSGPGVTGQAQDDGLQCAELLLQAADVSSAEELATLSTPDLIDAGMKATVLDAELQKHRGFGASTANRGTMMFSPGIHSVHLPENPLTDASREIVPWADEISMIYGYTTLEATLFMSNIPGALGWDEEQSKQALQRCFPDTHAEIAQRYEDFYGPERPHLRLARILSDSSFRSGQRRLAKMREGAAAPSYMFHFSYIPEVLDGVLGSAHSMEVPFIFDMVDRSPVVGQRHERFALAKTTSSSVANFAKVGDPTSTGGPTWLPVSPDTPHTMTFGDEVYATDASDEDEVVLWGEW